MGLTSNTGPYNAAAEHFGADDPVMVKTPRLLYNFSIEFSLNGGVFGPYEIASGVTLTISSGATFTIL